MRPGLLPTSTRAPWLTRIWKEGDKMSSRDILSQAM